jgi:cytochrome c
LHLKYPIESLERPLAEGIITNHPTMPQFRLEPDQIRDVIVYLKTLERRKPALRSSQGDPP